MESHLTNNSEAIEAEVTLACMEHGRQRDEVTLICVTKSVSTEIAKQVVENGLYHLGENRTEALLGKKEALKDYYEIKWHFIGRLQRRKVKDIINEIDYFHALSDDKLASEIQKRATKTIKCFVQVNVSGEETKQGLSPEMLLTFIKSLSQHSRIEVVGLMTMAPYDANEEQLNQYFKELKQLQEEVASQEWSHAPCLETSMGMSQDYPLAIANGATFIRVGTRFFS